MISPYGIAGNRGGRPTISPFLMDSNYFIPDSLESSMDLCKFLFYMNPTFVEATCNVVSHFITEFDIADEHVSTAEKKDWKEYYNDHLQLPLRLLEAGMDDGCFGNAFIYIFFPFDRFLKDTRSGHLIEYSLDMFPQEAVKFSLSSLTYTVPDPKNPGSTVSLPFRDKRSLNRERIRLRRIDPSRVIIESSQFSGAKRFVWRFEEVLCSNVKAGRLAEVNDLPIAMLEAIRAGRWWEFKEGEVYHMVRPSISGISNYGWGLPPVIRNYHNLHQLQVYRKIDESIGQDFMIPYRMMAPAPTSSATDATRMVDSTQWSMHIRRLMKSRDINPAAIMTLPFPVQLQQFSGDGKALVQKDIIEWHTNNMLDGMGVPKELFHGTVGLPLAPMRIRFFERSHEHVASSYRGLTRWLNRRILDWLNRERFELTLMAPTVADSLENKQIRMQLAAGGDISRETAYEGIVPDPIAEFNKRNKEDMEKERIAAKGQQQMQLEQQGGSLNSALQTPQGQDGGGAGQGGGEQPSGAGPTPEGVGMSPLDTQGKAQEMAQKWLGMDEGTRRKDMMQVKATRPDMYAYAKQMMDEMRSQGASQGRAQVGKQ